MTEALGYIAFAIALASLILHFVAPKTKTKVDDKIMDFVDKGADLLPKLAPMAKEEAPKAEKKADGTVVRDHR